MRTFFNIIGLIVMLFSCVRLFGQSVETDDNYFLVDTSNFHQLTSRERTLLDKYLPEIHATSSDTQKVHLICEMYAQFNDNDVWVLYLDVVNSLLDSTSIQKEFPDFYMFYKVHYYNDNGYYLKGKSRLIEAQEHYLKVLKLYDEYPFKSNYIKGNALNNIAKLYQQQEDYRTSLKYQLLANAIYEEEQLPFEMALGQSNMGMIYQDFRKLDSARMCYENAVSQLDTMSDRYRDDNLFAATLIRLAVIQEMDGNMDEGIRVCNRALALAKGTGNKYWMSNCYTYLTRVYRRKGLLDSARYFGKEAYELANEGNYNLGKLKASYENYRVLKERKKYDEALSMYEEYVKWQDSIRNKDNYQMILRKEEDYKYEKKKALDLKEIEKQNALRDQKQRQQFIVLVIVIIAASLVFILLLVIYRRLKITKEQKLIIEERNFEVEAQRDQIEAQKNTIELKHQEIQESIEYAKRIQTAILPPDKMLKDHLPEHFVLYIPKDVVAGDFYWLEATDIHTFFAVADCTGHGVPGAMVSVVCHGALNRSIREYKMDTPAAILNKTRELVLDTFEKSEEQMKDGMDISLCMLNRKTGALQYAGANNPLYIIRGSGRDMPSAQDADILEIIKPDKQPIGYADEYLPFTNHEVELQQGDSIYLFSDGFPDQFGGPKGKKLGYKKFRNHLVEIIKLGPESQKADLKRFFEEWKRSEEQLDDVCVMGVRF